MGDALKFTVPEMLGLLGVAQCIYILVYMVFRSGRLSRGTLPAVYFGVLGLALLLDVAERFWEPFVAYYSHIPWVF